MILSSFMCITSGLLLIAICLCKPFHNPFLIVHTLNVFLEEWLQIIRPKLVKVQCFQLQEVRSTDLIILIQILNGSNFLVKGSHPSDCLSLQLLVFQRRKHLKALIRSELYETEATTHGKIKAVHRAVDIVHGADDIDIFRNIELFTGVRVQIGILRRDFSGFAAITGIYHKEQFTENL